MLIERTTEVKICFIDYCRGCDKVRHKHVTEMLENINIDSKDLRVIKKHILATEAVIKVG